MISKNKSKVFISPEARQSLGKKQSRLIKGFSEICPSAHKLCRAQAAATAQLYSKYGTIPEGVFSYGACSTQGFTNFQIICSNCGEDLATVWAKDNSLKVWQRLRYTSWHDDKQWFGLYGINLLNDIIKIECTCSPGIRQDVTNFIIQEIK